MHIVVCYGDYNLDATACASLTDARNLARFIATRSTFDEEGSIIAIYDTGAVTRPNQDMFNLLDSEEVEAWANGEEYNEDEEDYDAGTTSQ